MAVTVTLSRNLQRVRIHIDNTAPAATITQVIRSDVSGVAAVRVDAGKLPNSAASFDVYDYEYAFIADTVPVTYTVYATTGIVATATITPAITARGLSYLTVPRRPTLGFQLAGSTTFDVVVTFDESRLSPSTVHRVVGRADPVVVLAPLAFSTGTMTIRSASLAGAQRVAQVLSNAEIFMLRQSDQVNLDFYFAVASVAMTHSDQDWTRVPRPERRWDVAVGFTRVAAPPGVLVPAKAWTYDLLAAGYRDYLTVRGSFTTYTDVVQNTPHA
jgi:hypothetical protein